MLPPIQNKNTTNRVFLKSYYMYSSFNQEKLIKSPNYIKLRQFIKTATRGVAIAYHLGPPPFVPVFSAGGITL